MTTYKFVQSPFPEDFPRDADKDVTLEGSRDEPHVLRVYRRGGGAVYTVTGDAVDGASSFPSVKVEGREVTTAVLRVVSKDRVKMWFSDSACAELVFVTSTTFFALEVSTYGVLDGWPAWKSLRYFGEVTDDGKIVIGKPDTEAGDTERRLGEVAAAALARAAPKAICVGERSPRTWGV